MSATVCLAATGTLAYPQGGGHYWVFLNWALGLKQLGYKVIWLERLPPPTSAPSAQLRAAVSELQRRLTRYGLSDIALTGDDSRLVPECLGVDEAAAESDLLINFQDKLTSLEVDRFARSAFIDIDPGLRQLWISSGQATLARHDVYFTIGETVGTPQARFPDCGIPWHYTPPAVFLPQWPVVRAGGDASYSTVAHWWHQAETVNGTQVDNNKWVSFMEYVDVPSKSPRRLELALGEGPAIPKARAFWGSHGWEVSDAWEVSSTPWDYQSFIRRSRGEFSCAKATCMLLENAWISDRTLCYLASGKPAVVQYTGPSRVLPDADGLLRFRSPDEAVLRLNEAEADYERHARAARRLTQEHFDATKVAAGVLERALA
jgi:hypothetical protein